MNFRLIQKTMLCLGVGVFTSLHAATSVFGKRYCEIIYSPDYVDFYVFNTTTVNDCPAQWWKSLSTNNLKKELKASYVFLNGPRYWVIDEVTHIPVTPGTSVVNGMHLPMVARFHTDFQSLLRRHGPYVDYAVNRPQIYHFQSGREIFEIINPQGKVYVLHSISLKYKHQSVDTLAKLKQQIHIPKGWQFKSGNLNQALSLTPKDHTIHVVMDELENTYQLIEKDALN